MLRKAGKAGSDEEHESCCGERDDLRNQSVPLSWRSQAAIQNSASLLVTTGRVALLVDRFGSVIDDRRSPAYGLFPAPKAGGRDQAFIKTSHRRYAFLPSTAGKGSIREAVGRIGGASAPAGTCHACQYLTEEGVMGEPSALVPMDGAGYLFHDIAASGRSMGQLPLSFAAGMVAYRSHWPSMSTPATVMVDGVRLPDAETRSLSAAKEAVLPSSGPEVKARPPVAVLRPISRLCPGQSERKLDYRLPGRRKRTVRSCWLRRSS